MQGAARIEMSADRVAVEGNKDDVAKMQRDDSQTGIRLRSCDLFAQNQNAVLKDNA